MNTVAKLILLSLLTPLLTACLAESDTADPEASDNPVGMNNDTGAESGFTELYSGLYTETGIYTHKQNKVLTDADSYRAELLKYTSTAPADVDFSTGKVLLVDMGERPTSGYNIAVQSVDIAAEHVTANVTLTVPGEGCVLFQAVTNPYQFVYIPTQKEIFVNETLTTHDCVSY